MCRCQDDHAVGVLLGIKTRPREAGAVFKDIVQLFGERLDVRLYHDVAQAAVVDQLFGAASQGADERYAGFDAFVDDARAVVGKRRHHRQSVGRLQEFQCLLGVEIGQKSYLKRPLRASLDNLRRAEIP
jgi:hypothetical protein